jgi:hypothetical protein
MLLMPPEVSGLAVGDAPGRGVWLFMFMFMGIPLSIFCPGDGGACGIAVVEVGGICIPGMLPMSIFCGDACGAGVEVAAGIDIPGILSIPFCAVDAGDDDGVDVPGIFMPLMFMPCMSCFFSAGRCDPLFCRVADLAFRFAFRFAFDLVFGFDMSMPGMFCMSCP